MIAGTNTTTTTTTSAPYSLAGSFPHYKQIVMPADQREKILAMHEASRANAGIYVAVVLAMYVILLTMLLCRYRRRFPLPSSSGEAYSASGRHHHHHHHHHHNSSGAPALSSSSTTLSPLWKLRFLCDCSSTGDDGNVDDSPEEVGDVRMTTMAMTLIPRAPTATTVVVARPVPPTVCITLATSEGAGSEVGVAV